VIAVGPLAPADRAGWEQLFRGYNAFSQVDHPQAMYDRAWSEFQAGTRMHALGARQDSDLVGFVHFLVHPRTTGPDVCYLEDLFTAPLYRGVGVGRALIGAVRSWAQQQGCARVYWHTRAGNTIARALYDQVADNHGFVMYSIDLPRGD
jgi:GNAT superfamily N-acetyltransferase